jgi:4-hydroxybenzoate polyprenyltransferase
MTPRDLLQQMRVRQWTKNTVLFAGVVFSHRFNELPELLAAAQGFLAFSLLASSVYVLNDLKDVEKDRIHPKKRFRPIAAGRISLPVARVLLVLLLAGSFALGWPLGTGFVVTAAVYYVLNIAYTLKLKNVVILDVMIIALGFVLRAVAGVQALTAPEEISPWLLICTLFLALFLAVCKRRQERSLLAESAEEHRKTLEEYPPELVDQLIPVVTAATVISYAIYTVSPVTVAKFGTENLVYTIPFVVFGVFRYLYLVFRRQRGGSPAEVLLTDLPTLGNVLAWGAAIIAILSISRIPR